MKWKHLPLRVTASALIAGVTAVESAGVGMLFLRLVSRQRALVAKDRTYRAIDRVILLLCRGALPAVLPRWHGHAIQVLDAYGRVVSATRPLQGRPPMASFVPRRGLIQVERTLAAVTGLSGPATVRAMLIVPELCRRQRIRGPALIYVAAPRIPWYGSRRAAVAVGLMSAGVTAIAAASAYHSTVRTLAPVEEIREELAEIADTDLSRRIPVPAHQELRLMAQTLNSTLARLEASVDRLRRYVSEASHDLRGPIAGVRLRLEEALADPADTDWSGLAENLLRDVDRHQAIAEDILTLSRLDTGVPPHCRPTDLAGLAGGEIRRRARPRVPIGADLREGVIVDCDRLLVSRLLHNLLDNAERHAAGAVHVSVFAQGRIAVLEVADDGDGIAPEHRDAVFDRFTRLAEGRARDPRGTGLGLSISRQIAYAHRGSLTVEDGGARLPGARLVLRLPCWSGHG